MKKVLAGIWVALMIQWAGGPTAHAQWYIYVDTDYMLGQMSEYAAAQSELKVQVERWNAEADEMKQEIDRLYRTLRAESPLLTETMQQERMEEIKTREERLLAWQKEQFGEEGALVKRQQDLIRPLQDKIYAAVQKYARDKSYDLIFDRAAGNQLLFVSPKLDKSMKFWQRWVLSERVQRPRPNLNPPLTPKPRPKPPSLLFRPPALSECLNP